MSTTKEYIGNLQRRIANQRAEIEHLRSVKERQATEIEALRQRLAENENGYAQTLYLEREKIKDLELKVDDLVGEAIKRLNRENAETFEKFVLGMFPKETTGEQI